MTSDFRIEVKLIGAVGFGVRAFDDIERVAVWSFGNELVTAVDNAAQWLYAGEYTDEHYENYERWAKE